MDHGAPGDESALDDHLGLVAEKCGLPEDEADKFSRLDRADLRGQSMRDGGIDHAFRDAALSAEIVVAAAIFGERPALRFFGY